MPQCNVANVHMCRYLPDAEAALLKEQNVNVIAVGVGDSMNLTQLEVIASSDNNVYVNPIPSLSERSE
jgi:hypothetical protein